MNRRLSLCAAVLTSVLTPAVPCSSGPAPEQSPTAAELVQAVRQGESWIHDVNSFYARFESTWVKEADNYCRTETIEGSSRQIRLTWGVRSLPWLILTDNRHVVMAQSSPVNELDDRLRSLESPK